MSRDIWDAPAALIRQLKVNTGARTSGELADILERASDAERTALIDQADAPLQARKQLEERDRYFASAGHVERGEGGYGFLICSAENCIARPTNPNGLPMQVNVKRWWCERHKARAQAGDDAAWAPPFAVGPTGGLIDVERDRAEADQAEREQRRREARHKLEREEREAYAREMPPPDDAPWLPSGAGWWS
jgi:hypothetical protein